MNETHSDFFFESMNIVPMLNHTSFSNDDISVKRKI